MATARTFARSLLRAPSLALSYPSSAVLPTQRRAAAASSFLHTSSFRQAVSTRYTKEHEWVQFDDQSNIGKIGITEYAQKSLGDVVYVELPATGTDVGQGDQIGAVESVKAASDIYAPVSGQIEAVNEALSDEPGLVNKNPEEIGYLCTIRLSNPGEFDTLLSKEAYTAFTEEES
ncbi:hypothetical protein K437DRAFT_257172 [Tilletiaria anomala UBC 951]|uniref:Glycine cleavage system H protein n=1 Tax=Tilletiaria anomala (strain ATCC 24038 / CBS 436.72 / UBC 951) TaxID=1037660 RepID=A0A066VRK9_TILAU|nr:uncharacterized protein K437DRAFT_257172 [Tilletiaria anomala UBC 951]KDN44131.1 hypothetical protein K437DRAFT_257172 [Tilletiaria anomala UBC 951]